MTKATISVYRTLIRILEKGKKQRSQRNEKEKKSVKVSPK